MAAPCNGGPGQEDQLAGLGVKRALGILELHESRNFLGNGLSFHVTLTRIPLHRLEEV